MNDAIWALIGDSIPMLAGALLALAFFVSMFVVLLYGLRHDRYSIFKRMEGVLRARGLQQ